MSLKITKNKHINIMPIKQSCDPKFSGPPLIRPLQDPNFLYILSAPCGSGKTVFLLNIIKNKSLYYRKFDKIYWFSRSLNTADIPLPEDQQIDNFSLDTIESIIKDINEDENEDFEDSKNILFIVDDCVNDLQKIGKSPKLLKLILNRRHAIEKGSLSIMFTTQSLNLLPTPIRRMASAAIIFRTNSEKERQIIIDEYINLPKNITNTMLKAVFKKKYSFLWIDCNTQDLDDKYFRCFDPIVIKLDSDSDCDSDT
jgi:hypothetical protein